VKACKLKSGVLDLEVQGVGGSATTPASVWPLTSRAVAWVSTVITMPRRQRGTPPPLAVLIGQEDVAELVKRAKAAGLTLDLVAYENGDVP
jgi:hypothetical protein